MASFASFRRVLVPIQITAHDGTSQLGLDILCVIGPAVLYSVFRPTQREDDISAKIKSPHADRTPEDLRKPASLHERRDRRHRLRAIQWHFLGDLALFPQSLNHNFRHRFFPAFSRRCLPGDPARHEPARGQPGPCERARLGALEILREPPAPAHPGERPLHHPAAVQNREALDFEGFLHRFDQARTNPCMPSRGPSSVGPPQAPSAWSFLTSGAARSMSMITSGAPSRSWTPAG